MKRYLSVCIIVSLFSLLQGCAVADKQKTDALPKAHGDERHIGGDLYRHGRNIHHHPEYAVPEKADEQQ